MKFAVLGLPRYKPLKQLILDQFGTTQHEFVILEEAGRDFIDQGLAGLETPVNVAWQVVPSFTDNAVDGCFIRERIERTIALSDRGSVAAGRMRDRFSLPGMGEKQEQWVVDKAAMRRRLGPAGLSRVRMAETSLDRLAVDIAEFRLPVIVKPTSLGASLCVEKIERLDAIPGYVERCRANRVLGERPLMIESFIAGPEVSVEGVVVRGEAIFFGITESHTSEAPYFVGTGHDFFASHPEAPPIQAFVRKVIACLEMDDCPFHIELKLSSDRPEVIEAHSRYGGAMIMSLVERATGIAPFAELVRLLAGEAGVSISPRCGLACEHLLPVGAGRVEAIGLPPELRTDPRVFGYALDYSPGEVIEPDVLPVQYAGYVAFDAENREDAERFRKRLDAGLVCELAPLGRAS